MGVGPLTRFAFFSIYPVSSGSLATGHLFEVFRIPIAFNRDLRGAGVDLAQIVRSQLNRESAYVLVQARQLGRTRNRDNLSICPLSAR
jgi:hypothetical protein